MRRLRVSAREEITHLLAEAPLVLLMGQPKPSVTMLTLCLLNNMVKRAFLFIIMSLEKNFSSLM